MKKILFVATVVKAHIMCFHIPYLEMYKELGWHTAVAACNDYENPSECSIPYCDDYFDVEFERLPYRRKNIKAYRRLKKIIVEGDYDIIHCHTPVAAILTRLAARKARKQGTKVFYTAHGFHFFKGAPLKNWLLYFPVEWLCSYMTDTLITINKEDCQLAQRYMRAERIVCVPGVGIDIGRFVNVNCDRNEVRRSIGIPENSVMLLSVGELNENKNHQVIIKALAKLNRSDVHYAIAGVGEKAEYLMQLAKELGVEAQVHLLGYRKDIPELNKAADIFCFPSRREGLGLAAIEAMAAGVPIITSNVHGINDYSENGVTGFKCAPDDVNGFADAIESLICDGVNRERISKEVRKIAGKYELKTVLDMMKQVYDIC